MELYVYGIVINWMVIRVLTSKTFYIIFLFSCVLYIHLGFRSHQSYTSNVAFHSIAPCDGGQSLAVAGKDGTLLLLRIDVNSSKMALQEVKQLGDLEDGPIVEIQPLDHGTQGLIVFTTLYGAIICWDLRMPEYAWRLRTALRHGVITTFCVDPTSSWLATGTSGGKHICWDLRFRLPIGNFFFKFLKNVYS